MAKFIETESGYINADIITEIMPYNDTSNDGEGEYYKRKSMLHIGSNGKKPPAVIFSRKAPEEIVIDVNNSYKYVPSPPGYYFIEIYEDGPDPGEGELKNHPGYLLSKTPIVAWVLVPNGDDIHNTWASPIGLESVSPEYILCPDMRVMEPESNEWPTLEDFISSRIEALKEAERLKELKAANRR